jgi:Zn-dependent M16 (insulinase) family peptidase
MKAARSLLNAALGTILVAAAGTAHAQTKTITFSDLRPGTVVNGFRTVSLYVNASDRPMGARFIHEHSGFTFDVLQIQSVPQAFIWVNSFPTSDMGEPHTQEHLLLGKGNRGRHVAGMETMSLAESNAFTQQWRTCYNFNTGAGPEVFYQQLEARLDALLHPDYTDEEIRREVRNFGITENPSDGTLRLEEKGSVYNEMVTSFERPWTRLGRAIDLAVYGKGHPLSDVSGGLPAAIREMKPEDIRKFHHDHYHLANMGMIGSFPKEMPLDQILARTGAILDQVQPDVAIAGRTMMAQADLPKPNGAPAGTLQVVDYPNKNEGQPGPVLFAWPATLSQITPQDKLLLELFAENIAGDPSTNLYKMFIDSKTRTVDVGAKEVFGEVSDDQGHPFYIGLSDVAAANITPEKMAVMRDAIMAEIRRIAALPDGSPELVEFDNRVKSRIVERARSYDKFVNSPPGFGFRNTGSEWMQHLMQLESEKDFRKSVTMKPQLEAVTAAVSGSKNVWRDLIAKTGLATTVPYGAGAKASPALLTQEENERTGRIDAEVARLEKVYDISDPQQAIRRYKQQYDSTSAALAALASNESARFIDTPPLTLDDQLEYSTSSLRNGVPMVSSTFDNMTSATVGLALRLDGVQERQMVYLSLLPTLLTDVGVIRNGKPVSYEEMTDQQRNEILDLSAYFSTNGNTGRAELVLRGAGNNVGETGKAIDWMGLTLFHPDWRPENLPRIRDVIDEKLSDLRNTMQGREESWVNNPASSYLHQDSRLLLTTSSFLTRTHNAQRLRWILKDPGTQDEAVATTNFLAGLTDVPKIAPGRASMKALLDRLMGDTTVALPEGLNTYVATYKTLWAAAKTNVDDALKDLSLTLGDLPDESLDHDWRYLCNEMRNDLMVQPATALAELNDLRRQILRTGNARMFQIGSKQMQTEIAGDVGTLLNGLEVKPAEHATVPNSPLILSRLRDHDGSAAAPAFVGLVNPNTSGGVFLNSAPLTSYTNLDRESLLRFLAAKLYGGGGPHSVFMKTWGAGLAYSNGIGSGASSGRMSYYAERCPELPQTLRFVIDLVKNEPLDSSVGEYTIAQVFAEYRSASTYESRGEAMAADLADGVTPDVVRNFRKAILALRKTPNLAAELIKRKDMVYAKVLPGYDGHAHDVQGSAYMVIGPEKQLGLYEQYLQKTEGSDQHVARLYPRDFWMTMDSMADAASSPAGGDQKR